MKKLLMLVFAVGLAFALSNCTKEGPQGPPGADGQNGQNGQNGQDGQDANATCSQCHNWGDTLVAKIFQYNGSQHATGSTVFEGTRKQCAACHSSQGFTETIVTGADTTAEVLQNPAPINCRTCHKIHETYTTADWAFRTIAPFTLRIGGQQDLQGNGSTGNLCARCHQPRKANPWVTDITSPDTVKITSSRWGPHHSGQSTVLGANGAFSFGSAYASTNGHKGGASCTSCHGAYPAMGNLTGGHTLRIANEEEGDNLNGCNIAACHNGGMTVSAMEDKQAEVEAKIIELEDLLVAANIIDSTTLLLKASSSKPLWLTQKEMAVVWNFLLIESDRSYGIHNPNYVMDVLEASIQAIQEKNL